MKKLSGIYRITSPSGNFYIGSSADIYRRWRKHRSMLKSGTHHGQYLQAAWRKHGRLSFDILLICSPNDLLFYEQRSIDIMKPKYNLAQIAGSRGGVKWSAEAKERLRIKRNESDSVAKYRAAALLRGPMSVEIRNKISASVRHPEVLKKILAANTGRKASAEAKIKMSLAHQGKSVGLGRKHSAETRKKMSLSHLKRNRDPISQGFLFAATVA